MSDALRSLALPCLGEFLAALQIQYALLGKGRLPLWASVAGSLALWAVTQGLWGHYTAFSFWALFFNALRMLMASMFFGGTLTKKAFSVVACGGSPCSMATCWGRWWPGSARSGWPRSG